MDHQPADQYERSQLVAVGFLEEVQYELTNHPEYNLLAIRDGPQLLLTRRPFRQQLIAMIGV